MQIASPTADTTKPSSLLGNANGSSVNNP